MSDKGFPEELQGGLVGDFSYTSTRIFFYFDKVSRFTPLNVSDPSSRRSFLSLLKGNSACQSMWADSKANLRLKYAQEARQFQYCSFVFGNVSMAHQDVLHVHNFVPGVIA